MLTLFEGFYKDWIEPNLDLGVTALGALALLLVGVLVLKSIATLWANYDGKRGWNPISWFRLQPLRLHRAKGMLLANSTVRELLAPSDPYVVELAEGEKPAPTLAFLSSYPRAVRATLKANRPKTRHGKRLEASRQIRELARSIRVQRMQVPGTDDFYPTTSFWVTVNLNGLAKPTVANLLGVIQSQLKVTHLAVNPKFESAGAVQFSAHQETKPEPLVEFSKDAAWLDEHPAKSPYHATLAVTEDGKPWALPTHHTVIFGQTGSGKSSPIHSLIHQLAPHAKAKTVALCGIDFKRSELAVYGGTSLFKELVLGTRLDETIQLLTTMRKEIDRRTALVEQRVGKGIMELELKASKGTPLMVLVIDEMATMVSSLAASRAHKDGLRLFTEITNMGRSLGVFVLVATQDVSTEALPGRKNIPQAIVLKNDSAYMSNLLLGQGAVEAGYNPDDIEQATVHNGYKTSGIGYVKGERGRIEKVRFAHVDGNAIKALRDQFPLGGPTVSLGKAAQPQTASGHRGSRGSPSGALRGPGGRRPARPGGLLELTPCQRCPP